MPDSPVEVLERRLHEMDQEIDTLLAGPTLASTNRKIEALTEQRKVVEGRLIEQRARAESRSRQEAADLRFNGPNGADPSGFARGADTVYARGNGYSYFADLLAVAQPGSSPAAFEAMQRLQQHAQVIERAADDLPAMFRATRERRGAHQETRVNPNRTDGQGGYFVPPLWIIDEFVPLLRAGRQTADRCQVEALPPGTDSINLPKVATGSTTAIQSGDAAAVSSTDITDTFVNAPVRTIAGQQDVALQLVEQSPAPNFDQVVMQDLAGDYNMKLDLQVLAGSAASGQARGILNVSGINAITYTDATPTLGEMWVPFMQAMSQTNKNRLAPPDSIVTNPSLWWWMCSQLDGSGRPFIAQDGDGMNSLAVYDANAAEGVVGALSQVPIVVDANMPTNLGAGTNETRVITGRFKDAYLWEGAVRTRVMTEVLSGTLQCRIQLYNYFAFMPDRYPTAFSVVSGTGLILPAGF